MSICHRAQSHRFDFEVLGSSQKRGMKLDPHRTPIRLQQLTNPHHACSAAPRLEAGQLAIGEARVNTTRGIKHHAVHRCVSARARAGGSHRHPVTRQ